MSKGEGGGRPRAVIDPQAVERAAAIGCTVEEIAAVLGVGKRTLKDRMEQDPTVQEAIDRGRATGRATLRRLQWQGANDGNPTMLIWLGKQMLGQRDQHRIEQHVIIPASAATDAALAAIALAGSVIAAAAEDDTPRSPGVVH